MPIYEYECKHCGKTFEIIARMNDTAEPLCPSCGKGRAEKRISAGSFRPNGIPKGAGGFTPPVKSCRGGG